MSSFAFFRLFQADERLDIVTTGLNSYRSEQLLQAIQRGDTAGVTQLLSYYSDASSHGAHKGEHRQKQTLETDERGNTVLHVAVDANKPEIVSLLLSTFPELREQKNTVGLTPLHNAAQLGLCDVISIITDVTMDVLPLVLEEPDQRGFTPLMCAVERGHCDAIKLLLSKGADVTCRSELGVTCIHLAVLHAHFNTLELLVHHIAEKLDTLHDSPTASEEENQAIGQRRRELADVISRADSAGTTPLHVAAKFSRTNMVAFLLASGARVRLRDNIARSALHVAALQQDETIVSMLMQYGDDPIPAMSSIFSTFALFHNRSKILDMFVARYVPSQTEEMSLVRLQNMSRVARDMARERYLIPGVIPSLKDICRHTVRALMGSNRLHLIPTLGLPRACESFLVYEQPVLPNLKGLLAYGVHPPAEDAASDA